MNICGKARLQVHMIVRTEAKKNYTHPLFIRAVVLFASHCTFGCNIALSCTCKRYMLCTY